MRFKVFKNTCFFKKKIIIITIGGLSFDGLSFDGLSFRCYWVGGLSYNHGTSNKSSGIFLNLIVLLKSWKSGPRRVREGDGR